MIVAGLLTPLEHLFRHILNGLHQIGIPWSWSIVVLTLLVRMLLVPLTVRQIHSMQNMQRFAPQMKEIQKKYKGDRQRLNEELMKFYKENNINPAASCLPLLAQIPVFIGLFYMLRKNLRADICPHVQHLYQLAHHTTDTVAVETTRPIHTSFTGSNSPGPPKTLPSVSVSRKSPSEVPSCGVRAVM